jgi:hypothetical protein
MVYGEFIEPESNDYIIEVRLSGIRKVDALALAEWIALLAENQLPQVGLAMQVAHVKYDY